VTAQMIRLTKSLAAWGSSDFETVLRQELERLDTSHLPLQQGLSHSSQATDTRPQVMIISANETDDMIRVKAGIFYTGIIAGCSCADDPTPVEAQPEYCVVEIDIDKASAAAKVILLEEES
jgi:hypothetical protein